MIGTVHLGNTFTFAFHICQVFFVAEDDKRFAMKCTQKFVALLFVPWNSVFYPLKMIFINIFILAITFVFDLTCISVYMILFLFYTSVHLYFMLPHKTEGGLAMYRSALVQNKHLSQLAKVNRRHDFDIVLFYCKIHYS